MTFTCEKCGQTFSSKRYATHLKRQTPCKAKQTVQIQVEDVVEYVV